ncbi:hypothetical protein BS47DRAFT_1388699 [Hydnum rufescens UP504]|uniref:CFEM domain-containing protein n=1 Tax=Hydnum rufescens UP504 TaxID=1448309 RepID=A0A9P6B7E1_9AGAM|nr:hypothetical protein BS47DRAFT_1388699 [Hydnum rufescens UP504]
MLAFFAAPFFFVACASAALLANPLLPRSGYPSCATPCLSNFNPGSCSSTDVACLCKDQTFLDTTAQCIYNDCTSSADIAQAVAQSKASCLAAGVTLTATYTPTQSLRSSSSTSSTSATRTSSSPSSSPSSKTSNSAGRPFLSGPVTAIVGTLAVIAIAL